MTRQFKNFARMFEEVYGDNGRMALAYYLSSLFSDVIYRDKHESFPMLFVHGEKGSGKSVFTGIMGALGGKDKGPLYLGGSVSIPALTSVLNKKVNGLVVLDEYRNNLSDKEIHWIRNIYHRIGYERYRTGTGSTNGTYESIPVRSSVIITGQEMPTKEPTLLTRLILIDLKSNEYSFRNSVLMRELCRISESYGSDFRRYLNSYRNRFDVSFKTIYDDVVKNVSASIDDKKVESKMIENYSVLIATMRILHKYLGFSFALGEFEYQCKKKLMEHHRILMSGY